MDKIRVLRIIEYVGDRAWIEKTLKTGIQGTMRFKDSDHPEYDNEIRTCTVGNFPEILTRNIE